MGIEAMGFDRTQYRKRRRTMDELDASAMTKKIVQYCVRQGAIRGFFYGGLYAVCYYKLLGLYGLAYGMLAGAAVGILNGVALSAINAIQRNKPREERYFIRTAAYVGPTLTFASSSIIFLLISGVPWDIPLIGQSIVLPAMIAAFAAWQAARKMEDWYFE